MELDDGMEAVVPPLVHWLLICPEHCVYVSRIGSYLLVEKQIFIKDYLDCLHHFIVQEFRELGCNHEVPKLEIPTKKYQS